MNKLATTYDKTKIMKKRPFQADDIIQTLISEPMNIDINCISYTPVAVMIKMPKAEYIRRHIGINISRKFDIMVVCREDCIMIKGNE